MLFNHQGHDPSTEVLSILLLIATLAVTIAIAFLAEEWEVWATCWRKVEISSIESKFDKTINWRLRKDNKSFPIVGYLPQMELSVKFPRKVPSVIEMVQGSEWQAEGKREFHALRVRTSRSHELYIWSKLKELSCHRSCVSSGCRENGQLRSESHVKTRLNRVHNSKPFLSVKYFQVFRSCLNN